MKKRNKCYYYCNKSRIFEEITTYLQITFMNQTISFFNWRSEVNLNRADKIGEDLILFESPKQNVPFINPFKLDISAVIISTRGTMRGSVNLKSFSMESPALIVVVANQILELHELSDDYYGYFILMSPNTAHTLTTTFRAMYNLRSLVYEYPCVSLTGSESALMLSNFKSIQQMIRATDNINRLKIIELLIQVMSLEVENIFHNLTDDKPQTKKELFIKDFIDLVEKNYREHRDIKFYADKMSLTPKYFSKVIKEETGKSTAEWINSYVLLEAKALLKSTDMTIQQISIHLDFPTQSHFGKYFKNHTGLSPKAYRSQ